MATVSGSLVFVSSRAAQVSEVWLHAREVRTHDSGVVTTGNDRFPVQDGQVEFTALPGPAVLALISQGRAVDTIPIVVGESEAQSLRNVVRAAQVVDEAASREIERLSAEMMEALDSAREEASAAQGHAETAEGHAAAAGEQVSLARGQAEAASASADTAREQASQAEGHASRAQQSAEESGRSADRAEGARGEARTAWDGAKEARDAAEGHASTAEGHATKAASSANDAQGAAGRADTSAQQVREIAESTRWDGDQVTVNGKQSPHLTGPRGPQGPPGRAENINLDQYARLDDLDERFASYKPKTTNIIGDKEKPGVPIAAGSNGFLAIAGNISMLKDSKIFLNNPSNIRAMNPPESYSDVANKSYVDEQVGAVRDRVGALESGGGGSSIWTGTKAEYDRIGRKDPNTLYIVR
ncbi:hypothetical protein ABRP95_09570 [Corynebacterium sp. KPL2895]|uniref:phage upper tail fiber protein n=1 Tax=Corynebacterium sp. KPL2895 TaxID=3158320 RepID=UPI0032F07CDB